MITVTRVESKDRGALATIFLTVFPETKKTPPSTSSSASAQNSASSSKAMPRLMRIPFFDFAIDRGEKAARKLTTSPYGHNIDRSA